MQRSPFLGGGGGGMELSSSFGDRKTLDWGGERREIMGATEMCSLQNENLYCNWQSREDLLAPNTSSYVK